MRYLLILISLCAYAQPPISDRGKQGLIVNVPNGASCRIVGQSTPSNVILSCDTTPPPKGDTGPTGPTGPKGETGDPGIVGVPCGTLNIGAFKIDLPNGQCLPVTVYEPSGASPAVGGGLMLVVPPRDRKFPFRSMTADPDGCERDEVIWNIASSALKVCIEGRWEPIATAGLIARR